MATHMRKELVLDALNMGLSQRTPAPKMIFHSDQGSQYASGDFQEALTSNEIICSMSERGQCWDNAVAESFFSTLKNELVYRSVFLTQASAKTAIAEWIEVFYNRKRRHSTLGYQSPVAFEQNYLRENC